MTALLHTKDSFRSCLDSARREGRRVGLVPTMGALHQGHLSLIQGVRRAGADFVAVTIFVNPLQFAEGEDLSRYPRSLSADLEACRKHKVDVCFAPTEEEMFPTRPESFSRVSLLSSTMEGALRPGHFDGVATIVQKLFHLSGSCVAAFGQKDFQQLRIIEQLVLDFDIPVRLLRCPIVRDTDGLALSSRNRYLADNERQAALALPRALALLRREFQNDRGAFFAALLSTQQALRDNVDNLDYLDAFDVARLQPLASAEESRTVLSKAAPLLLAGAIRIGSTRLIDNTLLNAPDPPLEALVP